MNPFSNECSDFGIVEHEPMVGFSFKVLKNILPIQNYRIWESTQFDKNDNMEAILTKTFPFLEQYILYQHQRYSSLDDSSVTTCIPYQTNHMQVPYHIHIEIFDTCLPCPNRLCTKIVYLYFVARITKLITHPYLDNDMSIIF